MSEELKPCPACGALPCDQVNDPGAILSASVMAGYAMHYGGNCRDCADEAGVCPQTGMPCGGRLKATEFVCEALEYGFKHGFVDPKYARPPSAEPRSRLLTAATRMLEVRGDQENPEVRVSARDIVDVLGACLTAPGSSPSGQAPTGLAGSAATIPSAGEVFSVAEDAVVMAEELLDFEDFDECSAPEDELCGAVWCNRVGCLVDKLRRARALQASAMSARSGETEGLAPKDTSAVGDSRDAQDMGSGRPYR